MDSLGNNTHKEPDEGVVEVNRVVEDNECSDWAGVESLLPESSQEVLGRKVKKVGCDFFIRSFGFQGKELDIVT